MDILLSCILCYLLSMVCCIIYILEYARRDDHPRSFTRNNIHELQHLVIER